MRRARTSAGTASRPISPPSRPWPRDLGLSLEQQGRIREVFKTNEARLEAFSGEFHERLGELRGRLLAEVKAVLTPEQAAKMDARIREFMDKRRKDKDKEQQRKGEAR